MKTILVANNHLKMVGGTESFTFTLIEELVKQGFDVEYFTFEKGIVSDFIEDKLNVSFMSRNHYDLILANHNTCVNFLSKKGLIIQTCHGVFPKLEQPNIYADGFVSISKEISDHLKQKNIISKIILNGINCDRFKSLHPLNTNLKTVLSLSQSQVANQKIQEACKAINIDFLKFNKYKNPVWDIEKNINSADLVIGLGRSAYDAMACGRTVISYDEREYSESFADGYLIPELINKCVENNCSGRYYKKKFTVEDLKKELLKYNSKDGADLREYALIHFNISNSVNRYLELALTLNKKHNVLVLNIIWFKQWLKITNRSLRHARKKYLQKLKY